MGKVVTREWWNVQSAKLEFAFSSVLEIIQVLDSISWVRCASGNVFFKSMLAFLGGFVALLEIPQRHSCNPDNLASKGSWGHLTS